MVKRNAPMITDTDHTQEDQVTFNTRIQAQVDNLDVRMAGVDMKLELLCRAVEDLTKAVKGKAAAGSSSTEPILNPEIQAVDQTRENRGFGAPVEPGPNHTPRPLAATLVKNINVEFPRFNGDDPRGWVKKCQRFFNVNPVLEHEKVLLAAMHLDGKADNWYMDYLEGRDHIGWNRFAEMVVERFSEENGEDIVEIFNNLKQKGSVEEYRLRFEELKAYVVQLDLNWTEDYFIRCFIGGLKEKLKSTVKMLRPHTLSQAIILAKHQENTATQIQHDIDSSVKQSSAYMRSYKTPVVEKSLKVQTPVAKTIPLKRLSPAEMEERKRKGLCFNCNEKFTYGHKCKHLFLIEAIEEDDEGER